MTERDVDPVFGKFFRCALRPFDQHQRGLGQWRQADLFQFHGIADAVKIRMNQRK